MILHHFSSGVGDMGKVFFFFGGGGKIQLLLLSLVFTFVDDEIGKV